MPKCGTLWCSSASGEDFGCRTQNTPWADGTQCGQDMWCQGAKCVHKNIHHHHHDRKPVIDGEWGIWNR